MLVCSAIDLGSLVLAPTKYCFNVDSEFFLLENVVRVLSIADSALPKM
jgi:hypothetical protein